MVRTQIYLTAVEHEALKSMSAGTGKKQSELIREAIDDYLAEKNDTDRISLMKQAAGIWKNRPDLPDFARIRSGMDRDND